MPKPDTKSKDFFSTSILIHKKSPHRLIDEDGSDLNEETSLFG